MPEYRIAISMMRAIRLMKIPVSEGDQRRKFIYVVTYTQGHMKGEVERYAYQG